MPKLHGDVPRSTGDGDPERRAAPTPRTRRRALELVAVRGRDVLAVRHLLDGTRATLGAGPDSLARAPSAASEAITLAEVCAGQFVLHVPARARVRSHLRSGLARLGVGPERVVLEQGDRAVVVLSGGMQVRAQIVEVDTFSKQAASRSPVGWLVIAAALYVAALAFCASLVPERQILSPGGIKRAIETWLGTP